MIDDPKDRSVAKPVLQKRKLLYNCCGGVLVMEYGVASDLMERRCCFMTGNGREENAKL